MLIDIHAHLLPGVDDGAQTLIDSMDLARQSLAAGVTHLIVTPHHKNNRYINHAEDVIVATETLQKNYDQAGINLKLYPGQEIRIYEGLLNDIYDQRLLSLDGGGRYYLIEFPTMTVPDYALAYMKSLVAEGIVPVIAHPERNMVLMKQLEKLYEFIEVGCLAQLTTSSYLGLMSEEITEVSQLMIDHHLVHVMASDAHHVEWRPNNMQAAFDKLSKYAGQEISSYFQSNARHIINGESIDVVPAKRPKTKKKGLFFWR